MAREKPNPLVLAAIGVTHLGVTALTWRDIQQRPTERIRGSRALWRGLSAVNTLGSGAYWLLGRRYGHPSGR
ncbi:hypothetical protein [Streptacidiphilus sp. PAMC 29251]